MAFVVDVFDPRSFPTTPDGDTPLELELFDSVAREPARLSGDLFRIHVLRPAKHRHPLYKEPTEGGGPAYEEPYEIPAALEYTRESATQTTATENGVAYSDDAYLWVARKELDLLGKSLPKVGDVIEFWCYLPFGDTKSQSFWDVTGSISMGDLWSQATYTMVKLTIKRRTAFPASEKVIKRS